MAAEKLEIARSLHFPEQTQRILAQITKHRFSVIEAPMGYGKTTAVKNALAPVQECLLWQKVQDHMMNVFWRQFASLVKRYSNDVGHRLMELGMPSDSLGRQMALEMMQELPLEQEWIWVIDDYHLTQSPELDLFLQQLMDCDAINLKLILLTRFAGAPFIDELKLKGEVNFIGKEYFEFSKTDIARYFKQCGVKLTSAEAEQLHTFTEGWISAVYLLMLNTKAGNGLESFDNIYSLIDHAVYQKLSQDQKDFLLTLCHFETVSVEQVKFISGYGEVSSMLKDIMFKNAFLNYDGTSGTYQMHSLFNNFMMDRFNEKSDSFKRAMYERVGEWFWGIGEVYMAMNYWHQASCFERVMQAFEIDKANFAGTREKEDMIKFYTACPESIRLQHPGAMLAFAMALITFNEIERFEEVCHEIGAAIQMQEDEKQRNQWLGEFELLMSFTGYNDISVMMAHHKRAKALMHRPAGFMDHHGVWTFGSPSVLFMFYRESGTLEKTVEQMALAMPGYSELVEGHGLGAEYVMAAEHLFVQGRYEDAEIMAHKARFQAEIGKQTEILVCAMFVQARLAQIQGNQEKVTSILLSMAEEIKNKKVFDLIHTYDVCLAHLSAHSNDLEALPKWIAQGDLDRTRLFFPAVPFLNAVYGRVLLVQGEYLKLLGISGHFHEMASIFPNTLSIIYAYVHSAAANLRIYREKEARADLAQALELAIPDRVFLPFVENGDFVYNLLKEMQYDVNYPHRAEVQEIMALYTTYQQNRHFAAEKEMAQTKIPLTEREEEIVRLAATGMTNKMIAETLFISTNTVKTQLKSIFDKLSIESRTQLKDYKSDIS